MIIPFQVSTEAEQCLTTVLSQYDPFRCLSVCTVHRVSLFSRPHLIFCFHSSWYNISDMSLLQVIVPLLVTEDEKTLVACINCLTKVRFLSFTVFFQGC